ncbi:MAG: polysaccharide deacetylase family protein [candidate division KSB1 bacterium]|nr:polysaccharide deacetylase family protein [candidate division KSB1 bacterium]MDZ7302291.1 polysaccharide deacetylase family protein [candidate division KSB1 bacterium]MDZ7311397.1 polysaccharide deacetylase family protein [candidate division KSB1 bacterium]
MKRFIGRMLKAALFYLGFFHLLRVLFPNRNVAILRYHAVVDPENNFYANPGICISLRDFERHVRYFTRRYRVISLDELVTAMRNGKSLPRNAVIFTFDDGYADNFHAAETLRRYNASGTFYVTVSCIDRTEPLWLFEANYLILKTTHQRLHLQFGDHQIELSLSDVEKKKSAIREVIRIIKSNNRAVRETIREQLRLQLADGEYHAAADRVMLTWDQVRQMLRDGMIIGSHTMTHLNLPNAEASDAQQEIALCREVLETKLGIPIRHFSVPNSGPYPYYNEQIKQMVIESGYLSAVTSAHGFVGPGSDLHSLHRIRTVPELHEVIATMELGKFTS